MKDKRVKIRFALDPSEWHATPAERMWAEPVAGDERQAFRLLNSPFYARGVSYLDVVQAVPEEDGLGLEYAGTLQNSGHSTIWLLAEPESSTFSNCWSELQKMGCTYERSAESTAYGMRTLYSVDVPAEVDVDRVLLSVEEGQRQNAWIFQVGHLGHVKSRWL